MNERRLAFEQWWATSVDTNPLAAKSAEAKEAAWLAWDYLADPPSHKIYPDQPRPLGAWKW